MSFPQLEQVAAIPQQQPKDPLQPQEAEVELPSRSENALAFAVYSPLRHLIFTAQKVKDIFLYTFSSLYHSVRSDTDLEKFTLKEVYRTDQSLAKLHFNALVYSLWQLILTPVSFVVSEAEFVCNVVHPKSTQWSCSKYLQEETIFYHRKFFRIAGLFD